MPHADMSYESRHGNEVDCDVDMPLELTSKLGGVVMIARMRDFLSHACKPWDTREEQQCYPAPDSRLLIDAECTTALFSAVGSTIRPRLDAFRYSYIQNAAHSEM